MCRRGSGFHEPECRRRAPREIAPSAAAPEPPQQTPEQVFADDSELASGWQSGWTANAETFSLVRECLVRCAMPLVVGGI